MISKTIGFRGTLFSDKPISHMRIGFFPPGDASHSPGALFRGSSAEASWNILIHKFHRGKKQNSWTNHYIMMEKTQKHWGWVEWMLLSIQAYPGSFLASWHCLGIWFCWVKMGVDTSISGISTPTSGFNRHLWIGSWPNSQAILVYVVTNTCKPNQAEFELALFREFQPVVILSDCKSYHETTMNISGWSWVFRSFLVEITVEKFGNPPSGNPPRRGHPLFMTHFMTPLGKLERLTTECPPWTSNGFNGTWIVSCRFSVNTTSPLINIHLTSISIFIQQWNNTTKINGYEVISIDMGIKTYDSMTLPYAILGENHHPFTSFSSGYHPGTRLSTTFTRTPAFSPEFFWVLKFDQHNMEVSVLSWGYHCFIQHYPLVNVYITMEKHNV